MDDLTVGSTRVPPGTLSKFELPVARLATGSWLSLPVAVIHGKQPGPTIWLTAAIHGDELNGVPIIRRVLSRVEPKKLAGSIIAVPVVNVYGLLNASRYLPDRRDLNRSFPGSRRGSLASQMAALLMEKIITRCDFGIDLHAGSNGRSNMPQIRCHLDDAQTRDAAMAFGPPVILNAEIREGSLRGAAGKMGIRCLLYETGEAHRFDIQGINLGIDGVLRVMHHLGMIDGAPPPPEVEPFVSRSSRWLRARRSGFCEIIAEHGQPVEAGQQIARVFDALGNYEVGVKTDRAGLVIGHLCSASVNRGDAIAHVAEREPADTERK